MKKYFFIAVLAVAGMAMVSCEGKSVEEKCEAYAESKANIDSLEVQVNEYYDNCLAKLDEQKKNDLNGVSGTEKKAVEKSYASAVAAIEKDREKELTDIENMRMELDDRWYQWYDRLSKEDKAKIAGIQKKAKEEGMNEAVETLDKVLDEATDTEAAEGEVEEIAEDAAPEV